MGSSVLVTVGQKVELVAPYHPALGPKAKRIGGRWDAFQRVWMFDPRDEERVRDLAREVYGTDGDDAVELVTLRYSVTSDDSRRGALWRYGRRLVERRDRDGQVDLGPGVIVVEGAFPGSGGSRQYPAVGGPGTVLEVRDVPATLVDDDATLVEEQPEEAGDERARFNRLLLLLRMRFETGDAEARRALCAVLDDVTR